MLSFRMRSSWFVYLYVCKVLFLKFCGTASVSSLRGPPWHVQRTTYSRNCKDQFSSTPASYHLFVHGGRHADPLYGMVGEDMKIQICSVQIFGYVVSLYNGFFLVNNYCRLYGLILVNEYQREFLLFIFLRATDCCRILFSDTLGHHGMPTWTCRVRARVVTVPGLLQTGCLEAL